jgi:uncharacterized protein (TIGR02231 family)
VADASETLDPEALEASAETTRSKVTKVTVFSDRARVTRQGVANVAREPTVLAFRNLPGWVDDGSVRVSASAGRIVDVRVERNFLAHATDERLTRAQTEHRALSEKLAALDDEIKVLDAQKVQIESIKAFSVEKITEDTRIGDVKVENYSDVLKFITDSLRATATARRDVASKRTVLEPEVKASLAKLNDLQALMHLEETTVLVTLQAERAAESTVDVTYMLPGATWQPMHELRVSTGDEKTVDVVSFAQVTQTSGEDWGDAELSFSTQSSTQSVRIPELEALTLGDTHTATRVLTSKVSSFTRAQQAFDGQSELWNKMQNRRATAERSTFEQVYKSNIQELHVVQGKTVQLFETLQRRGTTAHFKANAAPGVRGDGHPVRMRIGQSQLESTQKIVAVPEQSLNAAQTLEMTNATGQALLPGKVALYRDGTFLGMTEIDFVAEGESFAMFLGVADHLKLSRKLDRKRSSLVRKRRNRMEVAYDITVENLSAKATRFSLADRIPVSENREIRVDKVKVSDGRKPDSRGLLRWDLELAPKQSKTFRISYQVEYPSQLVLEARRRRELEAAASKAAEGAKRRPMKRKAYRIEDQLMDLEEQL